MHVSKEALIYIAIISVLTVIAIVLPVALIQAYSTPYRFIFLGHASNFTEQGQYLIYRGKPPNFKQLEHLFKQNDEIETTSPTTTKCINTEARTVTNTTEAENTTSATTSTTNTLSITNVTISTNATEKTQFTSITNTTKATSASGAIPETTAVTTTTSELLEKESVHFVYRPMTEAQVRDYLEIFVQLHHVWFSLDKIGQSGQSRNINNVIVMKPNLPKPVVMVVGGLLGQDWFSTSIVVHFMNKLLQNIDYSSELLNIFNFHFIPLLNPDGYAFSWSAPPINSSWKGNAAGINIVYDFKDFLTKEANVFKEHFLKHKNDIRAMFLLYSSENEEETCDSPKSYRQQNDKSMNVARHIIESMDISPFKYKEFDDNNEARIDDWVVETTKPKAPFVFNIKANYKLGVKKEAQEFIKDYGDKIFRIITKILYNSPDHFNV